MSRNPFTVPAKPEHITLETLPQLLAHHKAKFGGVQMTLTPPEPGPTPPAPNPPAPAVPPPAAPERPDGITEQEWNALGDPGRAAIVREREARQAAERALAASRARPAPPKQDPPAPEPGKQDPPKVDPPKTGEIDIAAIVQQAVQAAVQPFVERDQQREADQAANQVRDAVLEAAKNRLHDATDALTSIDLTTVLDGNGGPDATKIKDALDNLVIRKPHLAKIVDDRRFSAQPGVGPTPGGSTPPINDRVKDTLARMQASAGVKFAGG